MSARGESPRARLLAVFGLTLLAGGPASRAADSDSPLLEYASSLRFPTMPHEDEYRARLAAALHELHEAPPAENCAQSLGAQRFATMFAAVGEAAGGLGRHREALDAYEQARACNPRDIELLASHAAALYHAGRHREALDAVNRALAIEPEHFRLNALRAQLDFAQARWPQSAERFARLARRTLDADQAAYWTILAWLAERHAAVPGPHPATSLTGDAWPRPLLHMLRGELEESALLTRVQAEPHELRRREMLAEALYYAGQDRLLAGDVSGARRYFAATVNLKVLYFVEHHLALAALARLRSSEGRTGDLRDRQG